MGRLFTLGRVCLQQSLPSFNEIQSIGEILYGKKCNTPISWSNPVDRLVLGPEILKEMELIVRQVQGNLKVVQDRQKSQADLKRTQKEF